ncbi:hypothetical protein DNK57_06935 [Methanothermobacter thermautotrophicus]|uniref:Uncharacterized protein n=1 Tax=Methanothermobacter thermautotrophicus TaxID=145262 RepID=A0A842YNH8_METTF|nr:hypothetical protein [Methanothermobacter thermautotrophicus]
MNFISIIMNQSNESICKVDDVRELPVPGSSSNQTQHINQFLSIRAIKSRDMQTTQISIH